jgi:hypothetical protein
MKNSLIANVVFSWLAFFFVFIDHFQTTRRSATAAPESQPLITS